MINFF